MKVVKYYLAHDVKIINFKDNSGMNGFHYACAYGRNSILELLLNKPHGIEFDAKDNDGKNGLMWACLRGHDDTVRLILQNI